MDFLEIDTFIQARKRLLSDDEYESIKDALAENPKEGKVIPGTGGLRKLRWRDEARSIGRRGGLRIIYYSLVKREEIWMFNAYSKTAQADLTDDQKKAFKQLLQEIKKEHEEEAKQTRTAAQRRRRRR